MNSLQETQTAIGDSATLGSISTRFIQTPTPGELIAAGYSDILDARVEVTQVGERTVNIEEIITPAGGGTIEAEIKAPTVISISLHLSF